MDFQQFINAEDDTAFNFQIQEQKDKTCQQKDLENQ